jgi:hypothetical protein
MGLFDRPVTAGEFAALCADDPIPGLTDALADVNDRRLELAVSTLEECGLITRPSPDAITLRPSEPKTTVLDAHPLVREHFAEQLAAEHEGATRDAHHRLYVYLKQSAPELPDNLQDMMPLYHAVAHGCKADLHQRAFDDVYGKRILRGNEHYSWKTLGAFGADLSAVSSFFDGAWTRPNPHLHDHPSTLLTALAGFHLRALGRLLEAPPIIRIAMQTEVDGGSWKDAAISANNLSELYLTLGDVSAAVRAAEQSVELADRSGDTFQRVARRTTLADTLHHSASPPGDRCAKPLAAFREAEVMQGEWQREYPLLYGLAGFQYCDLLLGEPSAVSHRLSARTGGQTVEEATREAALERIHEVRRRAGTTLEWAKTARNASLLSLAFEHLTLGRTWLLEALLVGSVVRAETPDDQPEERSRTADSTDVLANAEQHLNDSVSLLRQAGQQQELPRGLLARAALWRGRAELGAAGASSPSVDEAVEPTVSPEEALAEADKDLAEAESIAQRGSMLIHQIDAAIERCRFHMAAASLAQTSPDDTEPDAYKPARKSLDRAKQLIEQTDKPYEPHVPDWPDWQPPEYVGVYKKGDIVGYHRRDPEITQLENALTAL